MTESVLSKPYLPYVPQTLGEIWDKIGSMMLGAPTFIDKTGYSPRRNIDTEFFALTESFKVVRRKLGEDRYDKLLDLAARAKARFAADPEGKTIDSVEGRELLSAIEDIIRDVRARGRKRTDEE